VSVRLRDGSGIELRISRPSLHAGRAVHTALVQRAADVRFQSPPPELPEQAHALPRRRSGHAQASGRRVHAPAAGGGSGGPRVHGGRRLPGHESAVESGPVHVRAEHLHAVGLLHLLSGRDESGAAHLRGAVGIFAPDDFCAGCDQRWPLEPLLLLPEPLLLLVGLPFWMMTWTPLGSVIVPLPGPLLIDPLPDPLLPEPLLRLPGPLFYGLSCRSSTFSCCRSAGERLFNTCAKP